MLSGWNLLSVDVSAGEAEQTQDAGSEERQRKGLWNGGWWIAD